MDTTLDPTIIALASAIKKNETGEGDTYNAPVGADGELGAYRWTPDTWKKQSGDFLGSPTAPMTKENQNKVAYKQIESWKLQGYNPAQIASMWNAGPGMPDAYKENHVGTSPGGAHYDTPAYALNVSKDYQMYKQKYGATTSAPIAPNTVNPSEIPDTSTNTEQPLDKTPGVLGGVANLIGGSKVAEGLGLGIANATGNQDSVINANQDSIDMQSKLIDLIKKDKAQGKDTSRLESALTDITKHIKDSANDATNIGTDGLTNKEVIGSAVQLGASAIPGVGDIKGAGTWVNLLTKAMGGAATGYVYDVGNHLQDKNKDLKQDFTPGLGTLIGGVLPFAGHLISALTKKIVGFTAGTGDEVIQRAIENPDAVGDAIKKFADTPEAKTELLDKAEESISNFVQGKQSEYGNALDNLSIKEGAEISKEPALDAFKKSLEKFGVDIEEEGKLDFSNSSLTQVDEGNVTNAWNKINNWTDESPQGLDKLRQTLNNFAADYKVQGNPRANVILTDASKALKSNLSESLDGYSKMLADYSDKSSTVTDFLKELRLGGTAKDSTKLNNIMKIFKKDPSIIDDLTKIMGKDEAEKYLNELSGAILSDWIPAGRLGNAGRALLEGGSVAGGVLAGHPAVAATGAVGLAASSPRIVGTAATLAGREGAGLASTLIKKGITQGASKLKQ